MKPRILDIFQQTYRELLPEAPMTELRVEFYPYTGVNHTIRLRDGRLVVRLSDLIEGAPENVLRVWPIGKAVGNFRNEGPQLLEPTAVTEPTLI